MEVWPGVLPPTPADLLYKIRPGDGLLTFKNFSITPHIGSSVVQNRAKMVQLAADHRLAGSSGEPCP
jgi:lactate dehydrogenase-like 2-hydroxyacid dehydrogenase